VADQTKFTDEMTKKSPPVPTGAPQPVKEWLRQQTAPIDPNDKFAVGRRKFPEGDVEDAIDKMLQKFGGPYVNEHFPEIWQELGNYFAPSQMRSFLGGGSWPVGRRVGQAWNQFGQAVGLGQSRTEDLRQSARNALGLGNQTLSPFYPSRGR
jgi:hypothetical protein